MIEIKEEDMIYRDFLDFKDVKHNPNLVIINENAYELKQQILADQKLRKLIEKEQKFCESVAEDESQYEAGQLKHILEESKNDI